MNSTFISPYVFVGLNKVDLSFDRAQKIIDIVCDTYKIPFKEVDNRIRKRELVQVRQAIMYFLRKETSCVLYTISGHFSSTLNHSTVLYAIRQYAIIYKQDKMMKRNHNIILDKIASI